MPGFSEKKFMEGFDAYVDEVDSGTESALAKAMSTAYDVLIDQSPIWSGSYVLSHRISIDNGPVNPPTDVKQADPEGGKYPLKVDPLTASSHREKARAEKRVIETARNFNRIEIGNAIEHAPAVEALKRAPYAQARLVLEATIKTASDKTFYGKNR